MRTVFGFGWKAPERCSWAAAVHFTEVHFSAFALWWIEVCFSAAAAQVNRLHCTVYNAQAAVNTVQSTGAGCDRYCTMHSAQVRS